jgi:hypothetical protein
MCSAQGITDMEDLGRLAHASGLGTEMLELHHIQDFPSSVILLHPRPLSVKLVNSLICHVAELQYKLVPGARVHTSFSRPMKVFQHVQTNKDTSKLKLKALHLEIKGKLFFWFSLLLDIDSIMLQKSSQIWMKTFVVLTA